MLLIPELFADPAACGDTPFACTDGKPVVACTTGTGYIRIRIAKALNRLKQRNYSGNLIAGLYACGAGFVLRDAAVSSAG